jgi:hypothetical protein
LTGPLRHGGETEKGDHHGCTAQLPRQALVSLIALINAYNRMNVIVQQPAGDYQPGMFG